MSNNTTNTSNPDSLLDDIDFTLVGTSSITDSSSYFSQQIDSITTGEQDIGELLTPDESFLNSLPGGSLSNTVNQVNTPISRFPEEVSAFPTLIMDDDIEPGFTPSENETPIIGNEINSNEILSNKDFVTGVSLKFPELKNFFIFLRDNKELSDFLKNKISSFFCGKNFNKPLSGDYDYQGDEGFVGRDSPIENINRIGLILMYCMYEFGMAIESKEGPEYVIKYLVHNFLTDRSNLDKFSHIMVSKNRRYFGSREKPKAYIQFSPEIRSQMNLLFNFLLNYAKSQKGAIDKLKEDDARAKRFAEKMERVRQRQEGLTVNTDLLNKMDEDEKEIEKKYGKLDE